MLTAEQLRRQALARAEARGRGVAKRRTFRREVGHRLWLYVFPVIGLTACLAFLVLAAVYVWNGPDKLNELAMKALQQSYQAFKVPGDSSEQSLTILRLDRTLSPERLAPASPEAGLKVQEVPVPLKPSK